MCYKPYNFLRTQVFILTRAVFCIHSYARIISNHIVAFQSAVKLGTLHPIIYLVFHLELITYILHQSADDDGLY